jgi:hypothetical protein
VRRKARITWTNATEASLNKVKAALLVYLGNGVEEMKYKASYKGLLFSHFLRLYKGSKNFIL